MSAARRRNSSATKRHDSDPLDEKLLQKYGIELTAPHRRSRKKPKTQDGRTLRRHKRRWKVERLFAWLQNFGGGSNPLIRHFLNIDRFQNNNDLYTCR
ncbi:MAG: hypothetical protein ACTFAL_15780 [Candidatus Electronema sp. V4]|uniref:hypothetical protein n=1 Tax=Candidatus Electronema sp. V4 TaxID=3454756 RepID=UPI0040553ABB